MEVCIFSGNCLQNLAFCTNMITPSFSLTATERVLPRLSLDFTTASLDSRITFARSGNTATVINSSGYIVGINANLPRFDFNPISLACKGLLIEEERVNLFTYSQDFRNTADAGSSRPWVYGRITLSANVASVTSPDGLNTADQIIEDTQTGFHIISRSDAVFSAGTTLTLSVFVKANGRTTPQLTFRSNSLVNGFIANFNLTTVTSSITAAGTGTAVSSSIETYPNGWFRLIAIGTVAPAATTATLQINLGSYTGDGSSGIYVWGAQLEQGSFLTSYIPTEASQVTRTADIATMTGTNFSSWWYALEGGVVVQAIPISIIGTKPAIQFDDTTANELITLRGVVADPQLFIVDGGATQGTLDAGTLVANTTYKLGGAWKASSLATAVNGGAAVTQASGTLPTVTQARLGSDGSNYLSGHLQTIRYWPQRIIDAEVQAFSK